MVRILSVGYYHARLSRCLGLSANLPQEFEIPCWLRPYNRRVIGELELLWEPLNEAEPGQANQTLGSARN